MRWAVARATPLSQRWLRVVVGLGPLVALLAAAPAGEPPPAGLVLVVALVSAYFAIAPESGAGALAMVAVVAWWGRAPDDLLHPSCLVAATALLASHLAALVAGYGPAATPVDPGVRRRWLRRGAAVLVAAPALWVMALVLREGEAPAALWPAGLLAAILVAVVTTIGIGAPDAR